MVQPSALLTGAVTVMGILALPTAMELLLPLEAGVAHKVNEAGMEGETHDGTQWKGTSHTGHWEILVQVLGSVGRPWPCLSMLHIPTFPNEGLGFQGSLRAFTLLLADDFQ